MRDLPLNKQQRKEGRIIIIVLGVLAIAALTCFYQVVNK